MQKWIIIAACAAWANVADAEMVEYRFEADVSQVSALPYEPDSDAETAAALTTLTGSFFWDSEAGVIVSPAPVRRDYDTGLIVIDQFNLSDHYVWSTVIIDRDPDPASVFVRDQFQIRGVGDVAAREDNITLNFADRTGSALSSLDLPVELDAAAFEPATLTFTDVQAVGAVSTRFVITSIELVPGDADGDGVLDVVDYCPGTVIPEPAPTDGALGNGRHALMVEGSTVFSAGKAANATYTTADTAGCSCAQIAEILVLGKGHLRKGCSNSVMEAWTQGIR